MFNDESRYVNLMNIVTTDSRGGNSESKTVRLIDDITGTFLHTLEEGERLDHLAYKYYEDSEKWWVICDANPGFHSPLALNGKEPVVTSRFVVYYHAGDVLAWYKVIRSLNRTTGICDVALLEEAESIKETREIDNETVEVVADRCKCTVTVRHNRLNISMQAIKEKIEQEGITVSAMESSQRAGKQIVIPHSVVE